jgi:fibronectin type 3 domain-containing protein
VRIAATLTLTCAPATTTIDCSWDAGPDGTTHYVVLRTDPTSTNGRVFTPEPGATSYVDTLVVAGTAYTYLVHALDSTEHSLAHSDRVAVPCCG